MKQTFEFNGNEIAFKNIECIGQINKYKPYKYNIFMIGSDAKLHYISDSHSTIEVAIKSRNELIQKWNEVLNESA